MRLLVGSNPHQVIERVGQESYLSHFGMLVTPRDRKSPVAVAEMGVVWGVDNYAFTSWKPEDIRAFLSLLNDYRLIPGCQWVVAPDVWSDGKATLKKFDSWHEIISAYGYPVALAVQDGMETMRLPWDKLACIFVGGSDQWRISKAPLIIREARKRGKWIHIGRVNSMKRLRWCQQLGANSVDGSSYAKFTKICKLHLPILQSRQHVFEGMGVHEAICG